MPLVLNLPPGRWLLQAAAPGWWIEDYQLELEVGQEPPRVELVAWPAGEVESRLKLEKGVELGASLAVFFRPAAGVGRDRAPPPGRALCPLEENRLACIVPAGRFDLRFQHRGFIPRIAFDVVVRPGKRTELGTVEWRRGTSVLGWVVSADSGEVEGAAVRLAPRNVGGPPRSVDEVERLGLRAFTATVDEHGFFQIDGIPPGAYDLVAEQEPYAPVLSSVRVLPGQTTELRDPPLVFDQPKTLSLGISPPVDTRGRPWSVELRRVKAGSVGSQLVSAEAVPVDGTLEIGQLTAAEYTLTVSGESGDRWWRDNIEVRDPETRHWVEISLFEVSGEVLLGEEPLAAVLFFGGRYGGRRVRLESDADGVFSGFLPRLGDWRLTVEADEPPTARDFPRFEVPEPKISGDSSVVRIELPNSILRGRVVDTEGKPQQAIVRLVFQEGTSAGGRLDERTDDKGLFEVHGLPLGPVSVYATAGSAVESDWLRVDVLGDDATPAVELILRPKLSIDLRVASDFEPIPGAEVIASAVGRDSSSRFLHTDSQGHVRAHLPAGTREVRLRIAPPGFAYRMLRVPIPEDRRLALRVSQESGRLIIEPPEQPLWSLPDFSGFNPPEAPRVYIFHRGAFEPLRLLMRWAALHGFRELGTERFPIPYMEPGEYTACALRQAEVRTLDAGLLPASRCVSGFLSAGAELLLRVPSLGGS